MTSPIVIGIELGGTKVVVAGSRSGRDLVGRIRIDTADPDTTLPAARDAAEEIAGDAGVAALGVGTFGPVDLQPTSPRYGTIVSTPKPRWSGVDLLAGLRPGPDVPVAIDTDVGAALVGEVRWGAADTETAAYVTVGTGIGGAVWDRGRLVHGMNHPEIGHVPVARVDGDDFEGSCPYHRTCLEGMASGPALRRRFGVAAEELGPTDRERASRLAAEYLAQGVLALVAVVPVETVVVGGGVSHLPDFHRATAAAVSRRANGYPPMPFETGGPRIVAPGLGEDAGVMGAIELGREARADGGRRS